MTACYNQKVYDLYSRPIKNNSVDLNRVNKFEIKNLYFYNFRLQ